MATARGEYFYQKKRKKNGVSLYLDHEEALALRIILGNVGGHHLGPRGAADRVLKALEKAGYIASHEYVLNQDHTFAGNNTIYFHDEWPSHLDPTVPVWEDYEEEDEPF